MSGYSDFNAFGRGSLPPDARLLQKPFTKETLLQRSRRSTVRATAEVPA